MSIDENKNTFLEDDDSFSKDGFELSSENEIGDSEKSFKDESLNVDVDAGTDVDSDKDNNYWTEETENAVMNFLYLNELFFENRIKEEETKAFKQKRPIDKSYCFEMQRRKEEVLLNPDRKNIRDKIFRNHIKEPLTKLVENILFNYRLFVPGIDIKTQLGDCYTFLYIKFTNFNPWQKTKSYSYYGTVAKHHYLGKRKEASKELKILASFENSKEEIEHDLLEEHKFFEPEEKTTVLFNHVIETIEANLENGVLTKNDQKVGDAIVQIFKNHEIMGVYNKNQIYQMIKVITELETKDITYSLQRFRVAYKVLRQDFNDKNE